MEHIGIVLIVLAIYLLPTIIAFMRDHASKWAILSVNLVLGWTIVVWFWAFIWSTANAHRPQSIVINNHNGVN